MALITEVEFAHETGALADTLTALPDLTVDIFREVSTTPDQSAYFFRFDAPRPERVRPVLESDRTVRAFERVSAVDDQHLWKIEFAPETRLLGPAVTDHGGVVLDARSSPTHREPRGWRERWFFPDETDIHDVWEYARQEGFEFDVLDLSRQFLSTGSHVESDPLTDQQRRALLTAYDRGYFEEPRESSLEELADELDLSPSAVNGRLKRGLSALIAATLVLDEPDDAGTSVDRDQKPTEPSPHQ